MGIDRVKLEGDIGAIKVKNTACFRQLFYRNLDDRHISMSNKYLNRKADLPNENKNILDLVIKPVGGKVIFEFSSKDILRDEDYPNKGMVDFNIDDVISDFNKRADGVYEIDKEHFLNSSVSRAEVFYDFPKEIFSYKTHEIINALSYSSMHHKERRVFGGETVIFSRKGFSIKVYDKYEECFNKQLGKKYKDLNLNMEETIRFEVEGKNGPNLTALDAKYFKDKTLREFLSIDFQHSLILDYLNEISFRGVKK